MIDRLRAALVAVVMTAASSSAWAAGQVEHIDSATLADLLAKGVPVVDIRTPPEWAQTGLVGGSHRVTAFDERGALSPDFLPKLAEIAGPNDPVVLICRTGNRSRTMANALVQQLGYAKVYNVTHGITRWIAEGKPVAR